MKNFLIILLITVLTSPFWGTYLYFNIERNQTRREVKKKLISGLDKTELIQLSFTAEESKTRLRWKHAGEFEFNGQMYDIVEQHRQGDTIHYTCYKDDKETRLNKELDRSVTRAMGQDPLQKNKNERLANFFKTLFQADIFQWNATVYLTKTSTIDNRQSTINSLSLSPPSPPPKLG